MKLILVGLFIYSLLPILRISEFVSGKVLGNNLMSNDGEETNLNLPLRSINLDKVSRSLSEYVDFDVDPCDDFHRFTCKKWLKYSSSEKNNLMEGDELSFMHKFENFEKRAIRGDFNHVSEAVNKINKIYQKCKVIEEDYNINCTDKLRNFALYAFASVYINNQIKDRNIEDDYTIAKGMINNIKEELKILINDKKDLFDEETRKNFMEKVDYMVLFQKFHKDLSDVSFMEECYKHIQYMDDYNFNEIEENLINYNLVEFESEEIKNKCLFYLQTDNSLDYNIILDLVDDEATYSREDNYFIINPSMLKEPYFSVDYPDSLNYGGLGVVIGHEIIHGFDSEGVHYNYLGKTNSKMISESSEDYYKQRSGCFEEQYGNELDIISNKNINGTLTLNENIADNGGIKIAHRAYMKYIQSIKHEESIIPGFENFTNEKLFFINFGRSLCEKSRDEIIEKRPYEDGEHSTVNLRVIKTLSNYKPFSKAFNCDVGRNMNSEDKCELW
uniref:Phosphate-regulating neutral endopeptidase (inferred by orthology to a human protein) n=1 Tax=Strongyloides venezuelensis TaxID=75913 RepID=A0A0K0EZY1_STRVS